MNKRFLKVVGCGNDFVLFDGLKEKLHVTPKRVQTLCHRKFGVGADGVLLLSPSHSAHFKMRIFNADGSEPEMCGNGLRCAVAYAKRMGAIDTDCSVETLAGLYSCRINTSGVQVKMTDGAIKIDTYSLEIDGKQFNVYSLDTGVPHAVIVVDNLDLVDLPYLGRKIRFHPQFGPKGTNVNWIQVRALDRVAIRTYERGVESETLACGTGATAAGIVAKYHLGLKGPVKIETQSQEIIEISWHQDSAWMTGPVHFVYEGQVDLEE